jgi:hypothetical protein
MSERKKKWSAKKLFYGYVTVIITLHETLSCLSKKSRKVAANTYRSVAETASIVRRHSEANMIVK